MVPTEWFGPQFKVVPWQPKWDSFYQRILYCSTLNVFASFGNCTIFSFFLLFVALSCGSFIHFGIRHRIEREGRKESVSTYKDTVYRNMSGGFLLFNNFNIDVVSVSRILCNIVSHQCHNCLTLSGVTVWQIFKGSISCSTAAVQLMQISGLHECELFVETVCILFAGCEPNDWHLWRYFNLDAYE